MEGTLVGGNSVGGISVGEQNRSFRAQRRAAEQLPERRAAERRAAERQSAQRQSAGRQSGRAQSGRAVQKVQALTRTILNSTNKITIKQNKKRQPNIPILFLPPFNRKHGQRMAERRERSERRGARCNRSEMCRHSLEPSSASVAQLVAQRAA